MKDWNIQNNVFWNFDTVTDTGCLPAMFIRSLLAVTQTVLLSINKDI